MVGTYSVGIENINEMRYRRGIEDAELRQEICGLQIGDIVKLTLVTGSEPFAGASLLVRITGIRGHKFRGKLAKREFSAGRKNLLVGVAIAFTASHIHSVVKEQPWRNGHH